MKKIFVLLTTLLLMAPLYSQKKNIVLVSHFQNSGAKEFNWLSNGITNSVITDLINVKDLIVISNNDRMKAIEEMQFQSSDLVNEKNNVKLGKILGAQIIVHGDYTVFMGKIKIIAKMIDVESTKVLKAIKIDGDLKDVFALQDAIVLKLLQEPEKTGDRPKLAIKIEENEKKEIEIQSSGHNIKAYELYSKGLEISRKKPQEAYSIFLKAYLLDQQNLDLLLSMAHLLSELLSLYNEAEKYLMIAEKIALQKFGADSFAYAKVLIEYGMLYRFQNITDKGLLYLTKAQQLLEKLGRQKTFEGVYVLIGLGSCKYRQLDNKSALEYRLKAKELADSIGLEKHRFYFTDVLNDIAITYSSMYQTEKAMAILLEAINKMKELGMDQTVDYSTLLFAVGVNYYQQGKNKESLPWLLKSIEILDKLQLQHTFHYLTRLHELADNYLIANDCKKALYYAQKAEIIRKKLKMSATDPYTRKLPAVFNRCKI